MSTCRKRLILWLAMTGLSVAVGVGLDLYLRTPWFHPAPRVLGLIGVLVMRVPLQRTGRLLARRGAPEEWGCTTRLVTHDIYACVRHPHHVFIGVFMTSLGALIGRPASFLLIAIVQWVWILWFLTYVEEPELEVKFGAAYRAYRQRVPAVLPRPRCLLAVLRSPLAEPPEGEGG